MPFALVKRRRLESNTQTTTLCLYGTHCLIENTTEKDYDDSVYESFLKPHLLINDDKDESKTALVLDRFDCRHLMDASELEPFHVSQAHSFPKVTLSKPNYQSLRIVLLPGDEDCVDLIALNLGRYSDLMLSTVPSTPNVENIGYWINERRSSTPPPPPPPDDDPFKCRVPSYSRTAFLIQEIAEFVAKLSLSLVSVTIPSLASEPLDLSQFISRAEMLVVREWSKQIKGDSLLFVYSNHLFFDYYCWCRDMSLCCELGLKPKPFPELLKPNPFPESIKKEIPLSEENVVVTTGNVISEPSTIISVTEQNVYSIRKRRIQDLLLKNAKK